MGHGICMDINPEKFTAPFEKYEFGYFLAKKKVQVVLFSSNWCCLETDEINEDLTWETWEYWVMRLLPIHISGLFPTYFVVSNWIGEEEGIRYVGSSCILMIGNYPSKPGFVSKMTHDETSAKVATLLLW